LFEGFCLQAGTTQHGFDKQRVIMRGGLQTSGGIFDGRFRFFLDVAERVVPCGGTRVIIVSPDVTATGHAERGEHGFVYKIVERSAGQVRDNLPEINEALAGVAKALAGSETNG